jgi:hypothetical protein
VLAIAVPAAVNPSLDRPSNTLRAAYSPIDRDLVARAADWVMDHRDELDSAGHLGTDPDHAGGRGLDQPPSGVLAESE